MSHPRLRVVEGRAIGHARPVPLLPVVLLVLALWPGCRRDPTVETGGPAPPIGKAPAVAAEPAADMLVVSISPEVALVLRRMPDAGSEIARARDMPAYPEAEVWVLDLEASEAQGLPMVAPYPGICAEAYAALLSRLSSAYCVQVTDATVDEVREWISSEPGWFPVDIGPSTGEGEGEDVMISPLLSIFGSRGSPGAWDLPSDAALTALAAESGFSCERLPVGLLVVRDIGNTRTLIVTADCKVFNADLAEAAAAYSTRRQELVGELMAGRSERQRATADGDDAVANGEPVTLAEDDNGHQFRLLPAPPIQDNLLAEFSLTGVEHAPYRIDSAALMEAWHDEWAAPEESPGTGERSQGWEEFAEGMHSMLGAMLEASARHTYVLAVDATLEEMRGRLEAQLPEWRVGNIATRYGERSFEAVSKENAVNAGMRVHGTPDDRRAYVFIADEIGAARWLARVAEAKGWEIDLGPKEPSAKGP